VVDALSVVGFITEWSRRDADMEVIEEACQVLGHRCGLEENLEEIVHQPELGDGVLVGWIG